MVAAQHLGAIAAGVCSLVLIGAVAQVVIVQKRIPIYEMSLFGLLAAHALDTAYWGLCWERRSTDYFISCSAGSFWNVSIELLGAFAALGLLYCLCKNLVLIPRLAFAFGLCVWLVYRTV